MSQIQNQEDFLLLNANKSKIVENYIGPKDSFMMEVSHIETNPLIRWANQYSGFYMAGTSIMKQVKSNSDYSEPML